MKGSNELFEVSKQQVDYDGIATGFHELDNITLGWQKGKLILFAG